MSQARDFLERFRPAGAPGQAAAAAVPADRARDLAAELEPVLARLAVTDAECARILAEADGDALRIRDDARRDADALVTHARERAPAAAADAAAAVLASADEAADAAYRAARKQAQAIRARSAQLIPGYVSRAVRAVRALAADDDGPGGAAQSGPAAGGAP